MSDRRSEAVELFGIPVQPVVMPEVLDRVDAAVKARKSLNIGVINAAKIVNMAKIPDLAEAVLSSDEIYADGMSVVWASRILRKPLPERIAGIDLMRGIMERGSRSGYRIFCLGAKQEILDLVSEEFSKSYPGVVIAGSHHGYFTEKEEERVAHAIRASGADVLFVAITSPKKEKFMSRWSEVMNVPVVHGVGGSFDIVAGKTKRAPDAWQRLGLEWLYRVFQEPRRLWKRYLVTNSAFVWMIFRSLIRGN